MLNYELLPKASRITHVRQMVITTNAQAQKRDDKLALASEHTPGHWKVAS